ncbi:MAG TPA: hypothetical protein DD727_08205 [Clostridiales bacterium]|nr:hypothetical protein [Clostridiales bacterium]
MKIVFAVVHDEDSNKVTNALNENGFSVTRLCSSGGFLRSGNTTLFVIVEEAKVDAVIDLIKTKSKSRKQMINTAIGQGSMSAGFMPYPVEVVVGGATIFVLNVERFEKV